ncbi:protein SHORTAGE IN CHIASMATA 1 homolog isoform X1 [Hordeum vulgare subsp. vulgare]|uniref:Protein SHORTAGE IN CHIASMATA 1 n=2 Tax=Hordeum vulgare subsp. vulgare TaxID=112509 RepID=A0A8I6YDW6_HORVV|nr:protein SHORTAGE IN CHIASMATA 1 homolog isoform X1 [Hordeum vulgare subsp. vulgare]
MRTRFLATDYFSPAPAASCSDQALALASLRFPPLPVPSLPADPRFPYPLPFPAAADLPAVSVTGGGLDCLPISSALSEFLAAVIPQALPVPTPPAADEGLDDFLYDRGVYSKGFNSRESVASKIPDGLDEISREKEGEGDGSKSMSDRSGTYTDTKRWELLKEHIFEVAEVDLPQVLEGPVASFGGDESGDGVKIHGPDVKIHLDFIDIDTEMTLRYPTELAESIYQVEKIPVKHNDEEDLLSARNSNFPAIAALDCGVAIPQLEVSRHSWELNECPTKAEVSNIFHNIVEHLGGAQVQHPVLNSTEFLRSTDIDMLAFVSKDAPCPDYQAGESMTVNAAVQMDLVRVNDNLLLERNSALYPLKPDGTISDLPYSVLLEEVQIIDSPSEDVFRMLVQSDAAELNTSDEIFKDDFYQARRSYESVVSSELVLVDDTFISLPTPILTDEDMTLRSMVPPMGEILYSLKPHSLSAADRIYLDWHLLLEGPCNREICSTYASMVEEVKGCQLNSELQVSCQQTPALGFDFLEYFWRSAKHQDEDKQNNICVPIPVPHDPPAVVKTAQEYRQESDTGDHGCMEKSSSEKATSLFQSMSQSSELNFYLNVRSSTKRGTSAQNNSTFDIPTLNEAVSFPSRPKVDKLIEIHSVSLPDSIRVLIKHIHTSYTSALQESAYLRYTFSDGHGLSISKQKLLGLITGGGSDGLDSRCKHEDKIELIVLYGLKQVAYYLCFFGLHAAHLYMNNLIGSFENIPERLKNSHCFIDEALWKAEKHQIDSHPSLHDIEMILRSNTRISQKILVVADRAFWLPLGKKLTSMKMTFVELGKDPAASYLDPVNRTNPTTWVLGGLPKSDCILLDNKNIPASFPFSEFGIILEYGGPNKSSTLLSLAPKLNGFPPLHFLYVKLDVEDPSVALVEDNPTDEELKATMDLVLHALKKDLQEKMNKMRIVDSLNFVPATTQLQERHENLCKHLTADSTKNLPADDQLLKLENLEKKNIVNAHNVVPAAEQWHIEEMLSKRTVLHSRHFVPALEKSSLTSSVSANVIKAPQDNLSATDLPSNVKVGSIIPGRLSNPVIVVNTGSHGKNMIFSRRSSYQQILSLEKGGMQVVERDIDLPVDLILSASVCLVWFETKIFGSNEFTASTETSSIPNFVETIATNILMSISFCFCGCIMVFEGEPHSLSAVMESSDSLYAAAASLAMNLQLFFSHVPKSTDEIIVSCIRNANRLNKAPSPDIPESESLAESFLTKFPSINPLSAYIILSCGGSFVEFLGWSYERRIQAAKSYLLSPQSISLFNALCKFGELGDSKSVMTDCSSVDSDICSALLQSPRKRKRCASRAFAVPPSDRLHPDPLNRLPGNYVEHNVFSQPKSRRCSDVEDAMPQFPEVFMFDQSLSRGGEGVSCVPRKHDIDAISGNQIMSDHFSNGLTTHMRHYDRRASSMVDTFDFSWQPESVGKEPIKNSFPPSKPSSSRTYTHPVFPTALEINDDTGDWAIPGGAHHTGKGGDIASTACRNDMGSRYHEPREGIMQSPGSWLAFLKQDSGFPATSHGLGWEMDYLRQMNEKRRAGQERSRCSTSAITSNSRMRDGASEIRSPPPIDSFRYRGGRDTPLRDRSPSVGIHRYGKARGGPKAHTNRGRKDFKMQPSASHENRREPSIDLTWTPIDKRARQKLLFAADGKEKQSKLIWRDQNSPGIGCGFRKRYREEGT